jgi:rhomboid protease GluP
MTPKTFQGCFFQPGEQRSGCLYGKGTLSIDAERLIVEGRRHRMFWFGAPMRVEIALADIYDAVARGRQVCFKLDHPVGKQIELGFKLDDEDTALTLLQHLPPQQSEAFAQSLTETAEFSGRIRQASPHAPVTPILVGINILVFIAMVIGGVGLIYSDGRLAVQWGTNYGPLTLGGEWWRLLTSTFIHFGIVHLAFNMFAFYQTGRLVERLYGSADFLLLYLFAGLAGSISSLLVHPNINSAGASGAIFGVFGALLVYVLNPRNGVPRSLMREHRRSTGPFIAYNLLIGMLPTGIDNAAHIGGLLGGIVMGLLLARPMTAQRQFSNLNFLRGACLGVVMLGLEVWPLLH